MGIYLRPHHGRFQRSGEGVNSFNLRGNQHASALERFVEVKLFVVVGFVEDSLLLNSGGYRTCKLWI